MTVVNANKSAFSTDLLTFTKEIFVAIHTECPHRGRRGIQLRADLCGQWGKGVDQT